MRFRTQLTDIHTLTKIIQTIHKVTPRCLVRLEPEDVKFICTSETEGVQIWCQLSNSAFFKEYLCQSNYHDQINLEIATDLLLQALRSATNAVNVQLRLTKRGKDPLLSFAMENAGMSGTALHIVQDVLISVLKAGDAARITEPLCPDPDVHIFLPKLYKLRTVAERMKAVSSAIYISANKQDEFTMSVEESEISMETTWRRCGHPAMSSTQDTNSNAANHGNASANGDPAQHFRVRLDAKSLLKFLSSHVVESKTNRTIACICSDHCAIFYVYVGEASHYTGVMTFFLPALRDN